MTPPRDLIYLSGPPAAGKSALMAELTRHCGRDPQAAPFAHDVLTGPAGTVVGIELGRRREAFSGTDALGMAVNPVAVAWITARPAALVLGEGDRLANAAFLTAAAHAGYAVTLVDLVADAATLAGRAYARGSRQDPAWVTGRATKAAHLADSAPAHGWAVVHVDATRPLPVAADRLRGRLPALAALHPAGAAP